MEASAFMNPVLGNAIAQDETKANLLDVFSLLSETGKKEDKLDLKLEDRLVTPLALLISVPFSIENRAAGVMHASVSSDAAGAISLESAQASHPSAKVGDVTHPTEVAHELVRDDRVGSSRLYTPVSESSHRAQVMPAQVSLSIPLVELQAQYTSPLSTPNVDVNIQKDSIQKTVWQNESASLDAVPTSSMPLSAQGRSFYNHDALLVPPLPGEIQTEQVEETAPDARLANIPIHDVHHRVILPNKAEVAEVGDGGEVVVKATPPMHTDGAANQSASTKTSALYTKEGDTSEKTFVQPEPSVSRSWASAAQTDSLFTAYEGLDKSSLDTDLNIAPHRVPSSTQHDVSQNPLSDEVGIEKNNQQPVVEAKNRLKSDQKEPSDFSVFKQQPILPTRELSSTETILSGHIDAPSSPAVMPSMDSHLSDREADFNHAEKTLNDKLDNTVEKQPVSFADEVIEKADHAVVNADMQTMERDKVISPAGDFPVTESRLSLGIITSTPLEKDIALLVKNEDAIITMPINQDEKIIAPTLEGQQANESELAAFVSRVDTTNAQPTKSLIDDGVKTTLGGVASIETTEGKAQLPNLLSIRQSIEEPQPQSARFNKLEKEGRAQHMADARDSSIHLAGLSDKKTVLAPSSEVFLSPQLNGKGHETMVPNLIRQSREGSAGENTSPVSIHPSVNHAIHEKDHGEPMPTKYQATLTDLSPNLLRGGVGGEKNEQRDAFHVNLASSLPVSHESKTQHHQSTVAVEQPAQHSKESIETSSMPTDLLPDAKNVVKEAEKQTRQDPADRLDHLSEQVENNIWDNKSLLIGMLLDKTDASLHNTHLSENLLREETRLTSSQQVKEDISQQSEETRFYFKSLGENQSVVISGSAKEGYHLTPSNEVVRDMLEKHEPFVWEGKNDIAVKIDAPESSKDGHPQRQHQPDQDEENNE